MRVCDYIAEYFWQLGVKHVYGLMGGGASGLNDGFIKHGKIQYVCFHNEQGAAHAAVAESKLTGNISLVNPTTGCGGTNCITSLLAAWQDSVPVIFISGNVGLEQCSRFLKENTNAYSLRKFGIQEHDIIETVKSITKYSKFVDSPQDIKKILDEAVHYATTGRPGPVWIDIPSNIQTYNISDVIDNIKRDKIASIMPIVHTMPVAAYFDLPKLFKEKKRPVVLAGQGIKQSKTQDLFKQFIEHYNVPYVYTYGASDLLPYNHPLNVGAIGIKGSRAGNFAMQSSDLLFILGCSLNNSHTGYDLSTWSPHSTKVFVTIDPNEFNKYIHHWTARELTSLEWRCCVELETFFKDMLRNDK
jgi:acetolactate synthase-1/2/3 large subunit